MRLNWSGTEKTWCWKRIKEEKGKLLQVVLQSSDQKPQAGRALTSQMGRCRLGVKILPGAGAVQEWGRNKGTGVLKKEQSKSPLLSKNKKESPKLPSNRLSYSSSKHGLNAELAAVMTDPHILQSSCWPSRLGGRDPPLLPCTMWWSRPAHRQSRPTHPWLRPVPPTL